MHNAIRHSFFTCTVPEDAEASLDIRGVTTKTKSECPFSISQNKSVVLYSISERHYNFTLFKILFTATVNNGEAIRKGALGLLLT